jgi:hypothetical protein
VRRLARLAVIAAIWAVTVLVVEAGARWYVSRTLGIAAGDYARFYARSAPNQVLLTWAESYVPHPYIGFGRRDQIAAVEKLRNEPRSSNYVIGILGASVAEHFAGSVSAQEFEPLRAVIPEIGNRRIRLVRLALGGYKQPQQFILASYLSDRLDLSINIDGLNELAVRDLYPLFPTDYPATALKHYKRSNAGAIDVFLARGATSALRVLDRVPKRLPLFAKSGIYFLTWRGLEPVLFRAVQALEERYASALGLSLSEDDRSRTESWRRKIEIWKRYTRLQWQVDRLDGPRAFFFLQPNQYLEGSKPFSPEERSIAITPGHAPIGNAIMELLRSAAEEMRAEGLPVFDLSGIFRDTPETVYQDSCCHLNGLGNRIMAEEILATIQREVTAGSPSVLGHNQTAPDSGAN